MRRLKRDDAMVEDLIEVTIDTPGGPQTLQVLRLETVPFWLSGVTVKQVRSELQEKLRAYKRWVVRTVYEAFMQQIGADAPPPDTSAPVRDLIQRRDMHRALAAMADAQIVLQQQVEHVDTRLDQAGRVVRDLQKRLTRLEQRLDPGDVLLDEQAAAVQTAVRALATFLTSQDPSKNHFQGIWAEIYRRFQVPDYKRIRQRQYGEVLAFLEDWLQSAVPPSGGPGGTERAE